MVFNIFNFNSRLLDGCLLFIKMLSTHCLSLEMKGIVTLVLSTRTFDLM